MEQRTRVLVIAIIVSFIAFLDGAVINVALPAIERELGGGLVLQQWAVDAYLLTLGALILLAGSLSDSFGRLRIIRIGLYGFGITSALCALAPDGVVLVVARGLQGAAGALLVPSSLALIVANFSKQDQPKAIGRWTAWTTCAFLVGPILGGLLVDLVSWRLVFWINVLPIAFVLVLLHRLGRDAVQQHARIDWVGAVLCVFGLGGTVYALIEQGRMGMSSPAVFVPLVVGVGLLIAFVLWERRAREPMLPLDLFRIRNFGQGNVATLFIYAAISLGPFALTIFLQEFGGFRAAEAGLATLPPTVMMVLLGSRFGGLSARFGPRIFMTVGPIVIAAGFVLMLMTAHPLDYWTQVLPGVIVFGLGLSITVAPLTSAILGAVDPARAGIGSAVNNAVARIAGLVAVASIGVIAGGTLDFGGFHRAATATAILLVAGGLVSWAGIRNPVVEPIAPSGDSAAAPDPATD